MAEKQVKDETKFMTTHLPVATPVTDENGEAVPLKDALEVQREQMKAAEEAEKAEAEKTDEEVAAEEKEETEAREEDASKGEETKMSTLEDKSGAPKGEPPAKTPANADKAGEKPTAKTAGNKEPVKTSK